MDDNKNQNNDENVHVENENPKLDIQAQVNDGESVEKKQTAFENKKTIEPNKTETFNAQGLKVDVQVKETQVKEAEHLSQARSSSAADSESKVELEKPATEESTFAIKQDHVLQSDKKPETSFLSKDKPKANDVDKADEPISHQAEESDDDQDKLDDEEKLLKAYQQLEDEDAKEAEEAEKKKQQDEEDKEEPEESKDQQEEKPKEEEGEEKKDGKEEQKPGEKQDEEREPGGQEDEENQDIEELKKKLKDDFKKKLKEKFKKSSNKDKEDDSHSQETEDGSQSDKADSAPKPSQPSSAETPAKPTRMPKPESGLDSAQGSQPINLGQNGMIKNTSKQSGPRSRVKNGDLRKAKQPKANTSPRGGEGAGGSGEAASAVGEAGVVAGGGVPAAGSATGGAAGAAAGTSEVWGPVAIVLGIIVLLIIIISSLLTISCEQYRSAIPNDLFGQIGKLGFDMAGGCPSGSKAASKPTQSVSALASFQGGALDPSMYPAQQPGSLACQNGNIEMLKRLDGFVENSYKDTCLSGLQSYTIDCINYLKNDPSMCNAKSSTWVISGGTEMREHSETAGHMQGMKLDFGININSGNGAINCIANIAKRSGAYNVKDGGQYEVRAGSCIYKFRWEPDFTGHHWDILLGG
ncbi:MAG: hypothetical protein NTZ80_03710 [Patescibacteria group bacterium]|nr:hypothetical protein [Patescibacteria group bacterium]